MGPDVEIVTEIDELRSHVAGLWPSYKFTPEKAANRLQVLRRFGLNAILDVLTGWEAQHPDERAPDWRAVADALKRSTLHRVAGRDDHANYYRIWFARPADGEPPAYATELLDADERGDMTADDWACWHMAAQSVAFLRHYHWCYQWPAGDSTQSKQTRSARIERLHAAHFKVRNLPTYGAHTEARKSRWLGLVEEDAGAGGVELEREARQPREKQHELGEESAPPTGDEIPF